MTKLTKHLYYKGFLKSCVLLATLFIITDSPAQECSLSMRVTESPPRYHKQNDIWKGLQIELITALMEEVECEINFRPLPWSRALIQLKNGKLDIMGEMSITPERKKFLNFIGPYSDETMVLIVQTDSDYTIKSLDDLKKIPGQFGLGQDTWYGKEMAEKIKNDLEFAKKIEYVQSDYIQMKRLLLGRIFGYAMMRYPAVYRLKTDPALIGKLKIHDFTINQSWNFWGISKQSVNPKLLARMQAAYDRLKNEGVFEKILNKYR